MLDGPLLIFKQRDDVPGDRIGIYGFSWGALKAVLAGAMHETLKVVIEDAGPLSFHDFAKYVIVARERDELIKKVQREAPDYVNAYLKMISEPALLDSYVQKHKEKMEQILGYSP